MMKMGADGQVEMSGETPKVYIPINGQMIPANLMSEDQVKKKYGILD